MPYCPVCGREIEDDAKFCPHCGAPVRQAGITYRMPHRREWTIGRVLAIIFGGIIILVSVGLIAGGSAVIWAHGTFRDPDGFLISREVSLQVDSYAIVQREVDIDMDVDVPTRLWSLEPSDFVTIKLVGESNDPSKEVFMGIAMRDDARAYLDGVEYDEVEDLSWSYNPWVDTHPQVSYYTHQGAAPSGPPLIHSFWVEHVSGSGTQTLEWEPIVGNFWVVVMNADGSADVDVDMQFGVKVPILRTVGNMLLVGGFVAFVVGGLIIYYGAYRPWRI